MDELYEGIRSALAVWPLWLILAVLAVIAWKIPKPKGKSEYVNQAEIANQDMSAQLTGMTQSNGSISPYYLSNEGNRDKY